MSEKPSPPCSKCGRKHVMVMSFNANGGKYSPPVCLKCLKAINKQLRKDLK